MGKMPSLIFILLFSLTSSVSARLVEVQGSAPIENGMTGKARALAVQNAISQAALRGGARVQSRTELSNHTVSMDAVTVTASGQVSNVNILDQWQSDNVMHVLIRAQVKSADAKADGAADSYRKKIAFTQFEVVNRASTADLPQLEVLYPRLLMQKLQEQGAIVGIDATAHLLSSVENRRFRATDPPQRETVIRIARELGVQFIISGILHDMSWRRDGLGKERNIVMELQILDGISGMVIGRHTFSETVWGGDEVMATGAFGSEAFYRTPLGKVLHQMVGRQISMISRDVNVLPFSARVIKSEGSKVYFDAGAASRVKLGDVFMAFRSGETVSSRPFLGAEERATATLVVKKVQPLFAMGELEAGAEKLKPGDIVRITW